MNWNYKVQTYLTVILVITGIGFMFSLFKMWYIPSPLICINLIILTLGLYIVQFIQKQRNKIKESTLILTISIYINLFLSSSLYNMWEWERVFTKEAITKLVLTLLTILTIYVVYVYVQMKLNYKKVKGNQKQRNWGPLSRGKNIFLRRRNQEKGKGEIYLTLGNIYENTDK